MHVTKELTRRHNAGRRPSPKDRRLAKEEGKEIVEGGLDLYQQTKIMTEIGEKEGLRGFAPPRWHARHPSSHNISPTDVPHRFLVATCQLQPSAMARA